MNTANHEIVLKLGDWFSLGEQTLNKPSFYGLAMNRRLIWKNGRPIGHLTSANRREGKVILWLQNYAGYNCKDFVLSFDSVDLALARAKEILTEWESNPKRPTWIA